MGYSCRISPATGIPVPKILLLKDLQILYSQAVALVSPELVSGLLPNHKLGLHITELSPTVFELQKATEMTGGGSIRKMLKS